MQLSGRRRRRRHRRRRGRPHQLPPPGSRPLSPVAARCPPHPPKLFTPCILLPLLVVSPPLFSRCSAAGAAGLPPPLPCRFPAAARPPPLVLLSSRCRWLQPPPSRWPPLRNRCRHQSPPPPRSRFPATAAARLPLLRRPTDPLAPAACGLLLHKAASLLPWLPAVHSSTGGVWLPLVGVYGPLLPTVLPPHARCCCSCWLRAALVVYCFLCLLRDLGCAGTDSQRLRSRPRAGGCWHAVVRFVHVER